MTTNADRKFLLITHTFATGPSQELRDYFIRNTVSFSFVENPFVYNKEQKSSRISTYEAGKLKKVFDAPELAGPPVLRFVKDFFVTIYLVIKIGEKYDVCVAANNLNCFSAWFLKKLGYINKLVYWTIDYTPKRFEESALNTIYHWMDRFCCYNSDLVWSSSKRMKEARAANGVDLTRHVKEIIVVDGCHFKNIRRLPDESVNKFSLVFMGHLTKGKGVDFILSNMPELVRKYPNIFLTIIGTGQEEGLKNLTKSLKVAEYVKFTGFVKEHKEVESIVASCGIALAPYLPDPNSFSFFSDVGKVKIYIACGLPVLITDVPEIAQDIQNNKAGYIFEYDNKSFVEKISLLLDNGDAYRDSRHSAIKLAEKFDWDSIFNEALEESLRIS